MYLTQSFEFCYHYLQMYLYKGALPVLLLPLHLCISCDLEKNNVWEWSSLCEYVIVSILQMALLSYRMKMLLVLLSLISIILPKPPLCPTQNSVRAVPCWGEKRAFLQCKLRFIWPSSHLNKVLHPRTLKRFDRIRFKGYSEVVESQWVKRSHA